MRGAHGPNSISYITNSNTMYKTHTMKRGVVTALLAVVLAVGIMPTPQAQAATNAQLQAQIAALIAQINSLQAQIGQSGTASGVCPYTWTRSLSQGSTGDDVRKLQQFLNSSSDTRIAAAGAGSAGMETTYFGPATAAAVSKFQVKYRSDVLAPSGLVNPTGYFGPATLAKANQLCVATTPTPTPQPETPGGNTAGELSGDGELSSFEIDQVSDTKLREGASDEAIAELALEAKNGDIRIDRMDIKLVADSGNTEKDPWDTFETLSLIVDGEEVATKDINDRRDFLNRTSGIVRFTGLDLVLPEDEEIEAQIAVSVRSNVKGAGTASTWNVSVDRIRYFDRDRVSNDDTSTGDLRDSVAFDIVERGEGEELKFALGSNNPDRTDIIVNTAKRTTNKTVLEYTIEAVDGDIELDTLFVNIETGTANFTDVVHDVRMLVGSKTFRKEAVTTTGSYSPKSALVSFDIDGDITIDEGDKETIKVVVDLKAQTAYANGETLRAQVTSLERNETVAEGSDDVTLFSGSAVGKSHRLLADGIVIPTDSVEFTSNTQGQNDTTGVFTVEFDVQAVEGDFYIAEYASTTADTTTGGVRFTIDAAAGTPTSVSAVLASSAREDTDGVFTVREGRTETFTLTIVVDASAAGQHRVTLEDVLFSSNSNGVTGAETYTTSSSQDYRSPYQFINN